MRTSAQKRMIGHICQTTFDLLYDRYYDEITVRQICEEADINRSTFYHYFEDKYELLYDLTVYVTEDLFYNKRALDHSTIFENFIYYIDDNRKNFKHLLTSSKKEDIFRNLSQITSSLILKGVETNRGDPLTLKIKSSSHPNLMADFYGSGLVEVLRRWVENDYHYAVDQIFEALHETLFEK